MSHIHAYLTFSGNCREAMTFYQEVLGGELQLQTVGESPMAEKMPPHLKSTILHASLTKGALALRGSDMVGELGLTRGNAVSLLLHCGSETETRTIYAAIAADGRADHALERTFWGALFGDLTDKFGNHWLLHFEEETIPDSLNVLVRA